MQKEKLEIKLLLLEISGSWKNSFKSPHKKSMTLIQYMVENCGTTALVLGSIAL